jgi:hypothetical protein
MQESHLYEYAVIRVVPRVEREEFLNVGVILYCPSQFFLHAVTELDLERLRIFSAKEDVEEYEKYLQAIKLICKGGKEGGQIAQLPLASRFRWLTATRSTVVQMSKVHPGFCKDPKHKLDQLFKELVL